MKRIMLIALLGMLIAGCAPTIQQIDTNAVEAEAIRIAREEGRQQAYNEALTVARAEMDQRLQEFMTKYKNEFLYIQTVKAGMLKPGQVEMIYMPGRVSPDGSTYSAPGFTWKVLAAPQFQADEVNRWWKRDEANFCYFFLKTYNSEKEAMNAVGSTEKPPAVLLSSVRQGDSSDKWAMIGKSPTTECQNSVAFYQKRGFTPVQVR